MNELLEIDSTEDYLKEPLDDAVYLVLRNEFNSKSNCDFKIHLPESDFTIISHKRILSKFSVFFNTFFRFNALSCNSIKIYGVNEKNFNLIITSMYYIDVMEIYFVKLNLSDDRVYELLVLSDYLQAEEIYQFLLSHLLERISVSTFSKLINFYQIHEKFTMIDSIVEFLISNYETVFTDKSILTDIPFDIFLRVCSSDELSCRESFIFRAILEWLKSNMIEDEKKDEILNQIRFAWVSKDFLIDCKEKFKEDKIIVSFLEKAISYHNLSFQAQNDYPSGNFNRPRQGRIKIYRFPLDMSFKTSSDNATPQYNSSMTPQIVEYNPNSSGIQQFINNPIVLEYSSDGEHLPNHAASHMWTWHNNSQISRIEAENSRNYERNDNNTQVVFINGIPYVLLGFPIINSHNQMGYF